MLPKETLRWIEQGERRCRSSTGASCSIHVAATALSVAFYLRQPSALGNHSGEAMRVNRAAEQSCGPDLRMPFRGPRPSRSGLAIYLMQSSSKP